MIQVRMKLLFLDSPRVQRPMDAATRRALSRAGIGNEVQRRNAVKEGN